MKTTRIKFCGITRSEDVAAAASLGVHALGFVFCPASPRAIDAATAIDLVRNCPPFITRVGLFMNQETSTIKQIVASVPLDLLQFHGEESEQFCNSFGRPYIKSIAMGNGKDSVKVNAHPSASALLLDSNVRGEAGGSGETFVWDTIPSHIQQPIILAGGLSAANVARAIREVSPYAVDVSSGIESAKGVKDKSKMNQFVAAVRAADEC